ncbi:unnamed protein product [Paramecium sonneborni]|uniref:Uncharacterized protein n=1 Tax=Paramecium sonneborni TaxID=65129 RepID=A0A8S1P3W5_9CILI|nr:unnamed protein product [Paramecium sonneborni]
MSIYFLLHYKFFQFQKNYQESFQLYSKCVPFFHFKYLQVIKYKQKYRGHDKWQIIQIQDQQNLNLYTIDGFLQQKISKKSVNVNNYWKPYLIQSDLKDEIIVIKVPPIVMIIKYIFINDSCQYIKHIFQLSQEKRTGINKFLLQNLEDYKSSLAMLNYKQKVINNQQKKEIQQI